MNKKAVLFTTRFLETNGRLFNTNSVDTCDHSFESNKAYCDFFLGKETRDELKKFICDEYYKDSLCSFWDEYDWRDKSLDDIMEAISEKDSAYDNVLGEIDESRCISTYVEEREQKTYLFPKKLAFQNNILSLNGELPKNELVKYIKSCKNKSLKKLRINIDCPNDYDDLLTLRFKLYKLKLPNNNIVAYAVWPLARPCDDKQMQIKWYEALYTEIINDNLDDEGKSKIEEVNLFLHDADIKPSTPFTVWEKNAKYPFVKQDAPLNIALFQHSNDPIATILSKSLEEGEKVIEMALQLMHNAKYGAIVYDILTEMDDILAIWHSCSDDKLVNEFKQKAILLKEIWNESTWEKDFPTICNILNYGFDVGKNLTLINSEINKAICKISIK